MLTSLTNMLIALLSSRRAVPADTVTTGVVVHHPVASRPHGAPRIKTALIHPRYFSGGSRLSGPGNIDDSAVRAS